MVVRKSMAVHIACYRDAVSCCIRAEFKENIAMFALLILRKHRVVDCRYLRFVKQHHSPRSTTSATIVMYFLLLYV